MLFTGPFSWFCKLLLSLIPSFAIATSNPIDLKPLLEVTCFGVWVVGADLMALILSSVFIWFTTKLTLGLILWIWDLLPFT